MQTSVSPHTTLLLRHHLSSCSMVRHTPFVAAGSRHSSALVRSSREEMMCCCLLLLLTLTSCVCAPTFVVKVTQRSYQAEENHNITLDWTFTNTQGSLDLLHINCLHLTDHKPIVLYRLYNGVEASESQFSGRVQCDRDVLREGRVRLHVSRLRTEDSGLYWCEVRTRYGGNTATCRLNITAQRPGPEKPGPERPGPEGPGPEGPGPEGPGPETPGPETPGPEGNGRPGLQVGVGLIIAALLVDLLVYL